MNTTLLLLSPKVNSLRNALSFKVFLKKLPFLFIGLIFWLLFYIGSFEVLTFILSIEFLGEELSKKLLSMTFFSLSIFLVLSNTITALSAFYISKDTPFLISKPIDIQEILNLKSIETFISSSWMVISFLPPLFIAYGVIYDTPYYFYIVLLFTFIPFLLIPCSIGIALAHLLTRLFPARKMRFVLLIIGLFLFLFVYIFFRSQWSISPESPERLIEAFFAIRLDSPLLPSFWMTETVFPLLKRQTPHMLYVLLLFSNAAFMLLVARGIGKMLFIGNLERIQPSPKQRAFTGKERFYPVGMGNILWKDAKIFFRDAGQWSQLLIISALILIYIYNFRVIPVNTLSQIFPFIRELMVLINMLMAGLVLSAVSARFIYSSVSLEGMAFWIMKVSPIPEKKILLSKFLFGFVPVTLMLTAVVTITNIAIGADGVLLTLSLLTILILCISISGLGTGLGALFPQFRYENIASISMSPGGMLFMLIAFSVVLLTVSLEAISFYFYKTAALSDFLPPWIEKAQPFLTGLVIIILNFLAFTIPMKLGSRRLEEDIRT
jgi:ABC-2 type transport system permease protein